MRKIILVLVSVIFIFSCIPPKAIFFGSPDRKDLQRSSFNEVKAGNDCFEFKQSQNDISIKVNDWTKYIPFWVDLSELSSNHTVRNLLVIQNDSILFNYKRDDIKETTLHSSYSIAKSFTSALIGIAIYEGFIENVNQKVMDFIP